MGNIRDRYTDKELEDMFNSKINTYDLEEYIKQDSQNKKEQTWQDISKYTEHVRDDLRHMEALILSFRSELQNIKNYEDAEGYWINLSVLNKLEEVLEKYDKHFNITAQRNGKIE